MKGKEVPEVYEHKKAILGDLESLCEDGRIDLFYSDQSRVSLEPCIPYGWQFPEEEIFMPTAKGNGLNCLAILGRNNQCLIETTERNIDSRFVFERLEAFSTETEETDRDRSG